MIAYYDTGVLLKLYIWETESARIQAFVTRRGKALRVHGLHRTECVSAIRLKQFRRECTEQQASQAIRHIDEDIRSGVLRMIEINWAEVWKETGFLAEIHAGRTGCRTLDTLHVACARLLHAKAFITSDKRQTALARLLGMRVVNPLKEV